MPAPTFLQTAATQAAMRTAAATAPASGGDFSVSTAFHDLLDVVNPLQHLPVVGTLYRAITGDSIGTVEKIAGDALYGGLWGAVGSVADTAFTAVTGKDFGATMLGYAENALGIGHKDAPVAVAANTPATPAATASQADSADIAAFSGALAAKGVDTELATRALYAYRRSQGLAPAN